MRGATARAIMARRPAALRAPAAARSAGRRGAAGNPPLLWITLWVTRASRPAEPRNCWRWSAIAQNFSSEFPLKINHLHECDGSVTGHRGCAGQCWRGCGVPRPAWTLALPMAEPAAQRAAARRSGASARCCWPSATRCRRASARVTVRGEMSGFTRAASGHCYFTLKDADGAGALLRCAMFRRAAALLDFDARPTASRSSCAAALAVYEPRGELQFVVEAMQRAGRRRAVRAVPAPEGAARSRRAVRRGAQAPVAAPGRGARRRHLARRGRAARRAGDAGAARAAGARDRLSEPGAGRRGAGVAGGGARAGRPARARSTPAAGARRRLARGPVGLQRRARGARHRRLRRCR